MTITAIVKALVAAGATGMMIIAAVQAHEDAHNEALSLKREKDRQRKRKAKESLEINTVVQRNPWNPPEAAESLNDNPSPLDAPLSPLSDSLPLPPFNPPIPKSLSAQTAAPDGFEWFWENYPRQRRGSQKKALAAYRAALKQTTMEEIHGSLEAYRHCDEVNRGFAKGAASWLNDECWNNDYRIQPRPDKPAEKTGWRSKQLAGIFAAGDSRGGQECSPSGWPDSGQSGSGLDTPGGARASAFSLITGDG